jgi:hypothetical protein
LNRNKMKDEERKKNGRKSKRKEKKQEIGEKGVE